MSTLVDFIIPRRPLSQQSASRKHRTQWREAVRACASVAWGVRPPAAGPLKLTIVYLCGHPPIDINNIVKPIEDALIGIIYDDDSAVFDIAGHFRYASASTKSVGMPDLLASVVDNVIECVYVRVSEARTLSMELRYEP